MALVLISSALRLYFAVHYFGFLTGDDVEILNEAFRRAFGLLYSSWDIRNFLVPDAIVAPFLTAARAMGITATSSLIVAATVPFILASALNIVLLHRLAKRWTSDDSIAITAAAIYAFHSIPLVYGSAAFSRSISTSCVLAAALLLTRGSGPRNLLSGFLIAFAFAARYSEAIYLLPLALLAARRGGIRDVTQLVAGFLGGILITVGGYDRLTRGRAFASLIAFIEYTASGQSSSSVAWQPYWWYLGRLHEWVSPAALPFLWIAWRRRTAMSAWLFVLLPLVLLSAVFHKELRYLQPMIPFVALLSAAGFVAMFRDSGRKLAISLLALTLAGNLVGLRVLQKKSMAATLAARELAKMPAGSTIALSQAWAYGTLLYLGNDVGLIEIPPNPSVAQLDRVVMDADAIGMYVSSIRPEHRELLGRNGFRAEGIYQWGRSRSVVLFRRIR